MILLVSVAYVDFIKIPLVMEQRLVKEMCHYFVEECLKDVELPFPTMDTIYLKNALWINVHWPQMFLRPFTREPKFNEWSERCNDVD